ncbi:hypothetical protein Pmar_PMAR022935 [Perkinsus marinus ATCC 50983]|uniref:Uncharacterized protein n=1 Tax=Perkinsus marinus (strain ATCC 50983 / TXsc) TaxID=423536 RepID=C5LHN3_PERM5|nr:hypothetical protein Pmar_PMAR022935 [Perkinsus marinus ATCC 50983]EER03637.1 hypothetical protein Pmar_PMAR022935 [Perkinsus marinus ATCC 50983]|eukprot:XP_002771821.1 hypothetical protein Pmar_PMAR022935 [Perkinsus marinus ATCC 50983]
MTSLPQHSIKLSIKSTSFGHDGRAIISHPLRCPTVRPCLWQLSNIPHALYCEFVMVEQPPVDA